MTESFYRKASRSLSLRSLSLSLRGSAKQSPDHAQKAIELRSGLLRLSSERPSRNDASFYYFDSFHSLSLRGVVFQCDDVAVSVLCLEAFGLRLGLPRRSQSLPPRNDASFCSGLPRPKTLYFLPSTFCYILATFSQSRYSNFMKHTLPQIVLDVANDLEKAGFEAYLVGGCVRDLFMNRTPKDWDLTTNAKPEETQKIFPDSFYENDFGTGGVKVPEEKRERGLDVIEITTFRTESSYSDNRRPDTVRFTQTLEEDLQRRDFSMNAIAIDLINNLGVIDPYGGRKDIEQKIIRAVGNPNERFGEDALRMMRAVRLSSELGFAIEKETLEAIKKNASRLKTIARERVCIELKRIIMSNQPSEGIEMLESCHLLEYIMPELREGIGVTQNLHHIYTVWEHNILALKTCPSQKLSVRLAALLHDVGKPRTKRGQGKHATFYNHDHVGARMAREMLNRLTFPREVVDHATLLVDNHLFYYNVDEVTESAVRRVIARVGKENIKDLIDVRIGDRLGSGVPKAKPYRLRHFEYMVEKVSQDPVSVKELKISGHDLIKDLNIKPGPKIGALLDVLLGEVIEDASLNTHDNLLSRARELNAKDIGDLRSVAKQRIEKQREVDEENMKKKYWVK